MNAHFQHLLHRAMTHCIGMGGGAMEHIGAGAGQDLQLLLAVSGAVGQTEPGSEHLRGVIHHKLHIAAIGVGMQRHIVGFRNAVHLPVVADVCFVAFIGAAAHAPRGHNAHHPFVTAVERAHRFFGGFISHFRRDHGILKAAVLPIGAGHLGECAVGAADAGQLPDAGGHRSFQVGLHRQNAVYSGRAAHHGHSGGGAELQPLCRGQRTLGPPELRIGAPIVDGLSHLLPAIIQMLSQGADQAMAAVAVTVHQSGKNGMALAVDDPGGRAFPQLLHGADGGDGVPLHPDIPLVIEMVLSIHCDDDTVCQKQIPHNLRLLSLFHDHRFSCSAKGGKPASCNGCAVRSGTSISYPPAAAYPGRREKIAGMQSTPAIFVPAITYC